MLFGAKRFPRETQTWPPEPSFTQKHGYMPLGLLDLPVSRVSPAVSPEGRLASSDLGREPGGGHRSSRRSGPGGGLKWPTKWIIY